MKRILLLATLIGGMLYAQNPDKQGPARQYNLRQASSDRAQLHTVAFSGLAFMTGNFGADTFFPPGKVADFFGFQYMRDNDKNLKGHNTDFLTRIATNVIAMLTPAQLDKLKLLAEKQAPLYEQFALKRMELIKAFRTALETDKTLNKQQVVKFGADLYALDAALSYDRATVIGSVVQTFTPQQKAALASLKFDNSATWPQLPENLDKQSMSHRAHVGVMTYASELFSWYAGSLESDVYFCPERHGTYFGGFYLKDFPAMGNHNYSISTALTGDSGRDFISTLTPDQRTLLTDALKAQKPLLDELIQVRTTVCTELRKALQAQIPDKAQVTKLIQHYGELDCEMSFYQAEAFARIFKTLTAEQKATLQKIRNQSELPTDAYLYSDRFTLKAPVQYTYLLNK